MADELTLEDELKRRAAAQGDAEDFWNRYVTTKGYLTREYYPWIQATCPFYTDHGELHIRSVMQTSSLLLSQQFTGAQRTTLSDLDIFLILSGVIWHDVGNVLERSGHADRVREMTEEVKKLAFPNPDIHRLVVEISKAHSGRAGLSQAREHEECSTPNTVSYDVYTRALAAVVRFADEVSENRARVSQALLPNVPPENQIYWQYANCISASKPDPTRQRVRVTVNVPHDVAAASFMCKEELPGKNLDGKLPLISYVLHRIEKMNNERSYCAREFKRYASIQTIEVVLTVTRGTERLPDYDAEEIILGDAGLRQEAYPKISVADEFFRTRPHWKPESLKEALNA